MLATPGITLKDRIAALKDALGPRRYTIGAVLGVVIGLADWAVAKLGPFGISSLLGVPSWAIGLTAALLFVTWFVVDRLAQLERRISGARVDLSKLRSEGVKIRNDGIELRDADSWKVWEEAALCWNQRTIECIGEIDKGCAEWFSVLDVVPPSRISCYVLNAAQKKLFNEHDLRVARLGDLIQALWER
jgi:hypothetical protein